MSVTSQAYGLAPAYHPTGQIRTNQYTILNNAGTGYGTSLYQGCLVKMGTNGTLEIGDGTTPCLGVFMGCEYIDATGKPTTSPYWPASTALTSGTIVKGYVIDDIQTVFRVGVTANASGYDQTVVGQQANLDSPTTGSTITGRSSASVATAAIAASTLAQFRILGYVDGEVYNATTNPYPQLLVQLSEVQFAPNVAGV